MRKYHPYWCEPPSLRRRWLALALKVESLLYQEHHGSFHLSFPLINFSGDSQVISDLAIQSILNAKCIVGKIYTWIFSFFRKKVADILFLELGLVSNESTGYSTFHRGIHEFLNPSIIEKYRFIKFDAVVEHSQKILWNDNYSIKTVIFQK